MRLAASPDRHSDSTRYGNTVYAAGGGFQGSFTTIGGQPRNNIAALDATSGLATSWNPNANGGVSALAVSGNTVYAGVSFAGGFTTIGGQPRNNIAALDATSGLATSWNPNANDAVVTLVVSGNTVYAGGGFGASWEPSCTPTSPGFWRGFSAWMGGLLTGSAASSKLRPTRSTSALPCDSRCPRRRRPTLGCTTSRAGLCVTSIGVL
jgi:hypothetical protein